MSNPVLQESPAGLSYEFGPFRLDVQHAQLLRDGEPIALSPKVFETLLFFVENPGRILTRDAIVERVWPDTVVSDTSLPQNIFLLRKALGDDQDAPRYLETVPRRGYRFIAEVMRVVAQQAETSNVVMMRTMSGRLAPFIPAPKRRPRWLLIGGIAALFVIAAVAGAWLYRARAERLMRFRENVAAAKQRAVIAPTAFLNESHNANAAWLRTAIPRMLADELAAGERVRTLPGESVSLMASDLALPESDGYSKETLDRIHGYSGADLVLAGSFVVPRSGAQLRFDARIQHVASGETIASASAEGTEDELFALVHRAGRDLRQELGLTLAAAGGMQLAGAPAPASIEAARLYARGVDKLHQYELTEARDLLTRAAAADPSFAQTHRALSEVWSRLGYDLRAADEARLAAASTATLPRAEQMQIEAAVAQATKDWEKLIGIRQSLWRFYPDDADFGLELVGALSLAGRLQESLAILDQLEPGAPAHVRARIAFARATVYHNMADWKSALAAAQTGVQLSRELNARFLLARTLNIEAMARYRLADKSWRKAAQESRAIAHKAGFPAGELRALMTMSTGESDAVNFPAALQALDEAEKLAWQVGDLKMQYAALSNRSYIMSDMDRPLDALALADRALPLIREAGDKTGEAINLGNHAAYYAELEQWPKARVYAGQALDLHHQLGRKTSVINALAVLSSIERSSGRLDRADDYAHQAMALAVELKNKRSMNIARQELADVLNARGHRAAARAAWSEVVEQWKALEDPKKVLFARLEIARIDLATGRRGEALRIAGEVRAEAEGRKFATVAREAGKIEGKARE